jgi:hypothetical protein
MGRIIPINLIEKPSEQFLVRSIWDWEHYREGKLLDEWRETNICTDEGLNSLLNIMFHAATQITTWYIAIFESDTTPVAGTTYATPVFTECTAYAEATREEYVEAAASSKSMTNSASKAEFTMNASKTVYGAALVSDNTKGDTVAANAVMYCASKFSVSKAVENLDILKVSVTLTSSDI